jgi:hypothetical protein
MSDAIFWSSSDEDEWSEHNGEPEETSSKKQKTDYPPTAHVSSVPSLNVLPRHPNVESLPLSRPSLLPPDGPSRPSSLSPDVPSRPSSFDVPSRPSSSDVPSRPLPSSSDVQIHRLSSVDKTGLEGTSEKIVNLLNTQKKGLFYQNQAKVEERVKEKVAKLKQRLREVEADDRRNDVIAKARNASVQRELAETLKQLENSRVLNELCLVVDMDAFYVMCELKERPELRGIFLFFALPL